MLINDIIPIELLLNPTFKQSFITDKYYVRDFGTVGGIMIFDGVSYRVWFINQRYTLTTTISDLDDYFNNYK